MPSTYLSRPSRTRAELDAMLLARYRAVDALPSDNSFEREYERVLRESNRTRGGWNEGSER